MTDDLVRRLRRRAHVHTDRCYGRYEPCGEHHRHDDTCGSRSRICGTEEDADLRELIAEHDRAIAALDETLSMLERGTTTLTLGRVREIRASVERWRRILP